MKHSLIILGLILVFGAQGFAQGWDFALPEPVFYGYADEGGYFEFVPSMVLAAAADSDTEVPLGIRNNKYFLESMRFADLAQKTYDDGDYDASSQYSDEAVRYAYLSDEYVRLQLKIKETDDAIAAARKRLDYADSVNAAARYPNEYRQAQGYFSEARSLRAAESWDPAIAAANRVLVALSNIGGMPADGGLPSQYTVRPWSVSKDCLWNIAGRPWVYNDPRKWQILYDANKSKMPEPNNPDLIHPGMVLDIPAIKGESRQGMWDANKTYPALP